MNEDELIFIGVDVFKTLKEISDMVLVPSEEWSEAEKEIYMLGKENVLNLLGQFLTNILQDEDSHIPIQGAYLVNIPGLPIIEEFGSIEELIDKYEEIQYGN